VDVYYLFKPPSLDALQASPFYYLQDVHRLEKLADKWCGAEYLRCEPEFAMTLSMAIQPHQFNAIVCVPTRHREVQIAYRQAMLCINPGATDYTSFVGRIDPELAPSHLEERARNLTLGIDCIPNDLHLLVIDDILNTGMNAAAVMRRFQMQNPQINTFRLACPLWIQKGLGDSWRRLLQLAEETPNEGN